MAETKPMFDENKLSKQQLKDFKFFQRRTVELIDARRYQYGSDIEGVWAQADKDYIPHRMNTTGKKVVATDEEKGWRGSMVTLGSSNWQSDVSQPNVFTKIQIALGILIDQNPTGVFTPALKKFQATTEVMKQLYKRSWEVANSKQQLKLFTFNLAKYGWAIARSYPLKIDRTVRVVKDDTFDENNPDKTEYEEKVVTEFNDIMRENLDPWNCWIDDMTVPNTEYSMRDWQWRKVYAMDAAEEEFGKYNNWKYVQSGGNTDEKITGSTGGSQEKGTREKDLVEIYFYENRLKDLFMVVANGVPVIIKPLPIEDGAGNKKLSCWQTYWNLRHAKCPYGVGMYEAMRFDNALLDRMRNMTIDQITMSIYKMFFYQGTQALTDTGDIKISPGLGKQVLDPKSITWLDIKGPGNDAWRGLEYLQQSVDESSGIGDPLTGAVTGKTAFELAQAKESALKRLKTPLENITDALDNEAYITLSLIQLLYSIPEVYKLSDEEQINEYLGEVEGDPELYDRDEEGTFQAKVFREFPMNLGEDKDGNLEETKETRFFRVKPRFLKWEGIINVESQSILSPSKQVDKALDLEMWNIVLPLLQNDPAIYLKPVTAIVELYDKDPKEVLPDSWLNPQPAQPEQPEMPADPNALFVPEGGGQPQQPPQGPPQQGQPPAQAQKVAGSPEVPAQGNGIVNKIMGKIAAPFK